MDLNIFYVYLQEYIESFEINLDQKSTGFQLSNEKISFLPFRLMT